MGFIEDIRLQINKVKRNKYLRSLLKELKSKRDHATHIYFLYRLKDDGTITAKEFQVLQDSLR